MITKITSIQELKQIFLEIFLNKTDKVNDVGNDSVLNGIAFGVAKIGQKCLVNQSVIEGHLFPDTAYGKYLDNLAKIRGISPRFGSTSSTTYLRLIADPGTFYLRDTIFTSTTGINFILENDVTVDNNGFAYAKVRSIQEGIKSNVEPLTINKIANNIQGHLSCTNEYRADGGRDEEDDALFRQRIKDNVNQLSRNTIAYLEQLFMKVNNNVLKVHKSGIDNSGKLNLIVVSVNGQDFTQDEFNEMLSYSEEFLTITELLRNNNDFSLHLKNVDWVLVDVDFRVKIDQSYDFDRVRKEIQIQISKLFDYRFWKFGDKVEWENILFAVRQVDGVRYVPDNYFLPRADINISEYKLPRVRGFMIRDLDGNIIEDNNGVISEFYYPNSPDYSYQSSVLANV